jgi:hypothetical protein
MTSVLSAPDSLGKLFADCRRLASSMSSSASLAFFQAEVPADDVVTVEMVTAETALINEPPICDATASADFAAFQRLRQLHGVPPCNYQPLPIRRP